MKTIVIKTAALMLFLAASITLITACGGLIDPDGECLVVIGNENKYTEYRIGLSGIKGNEGLFTLLEYLKEHEGLEVATVGGPYGKMLLSVGDVKPDSSNNEYVAIYTSVLEDADTSAWAQELNYNGTTLKTSGLGASSMQIKSGGVFLITLGKY